jgi:hypothetical protein
MNLFTSVDIVPQTEKICCPSKILTLGSCFSDHMGHKLSNHLFDAMVNPFGTIFNPVSIAKVLDLALKEMVIEKNDLQKEGNRFFHYDFHSSFDNSSPHLVLEEINLALGNVREFIRHIDFLILTFGTSIVYKLKDGDRIVSNCHKVPNYNFEKEFLSVDIMEDALNKTLVAIKKLNPTVKVIFTVSPVRHTKEGLIENSLSKSRLIELCHRMVANASGTSYFPSFEIMIDELRDYRYYKSDLIHPSELAIDIIWARFLETYFDDRATQKVKDIKELNAAKNHKPFDPNAMEHQKFRQNQLEKIKRLAIVYPEIDFKVLQEFFES